MQPQAPTPPPSEESPDPAWPRGKQAIAAVGWCSFLAACLASLLFFAFLDPIELSGEPSALSFLWPNRTAAYTVGFLFFWLIAAVAAGLSVYMLYTARPGRGGSDPP
jgi:hypothetical protein